MRLAQTGSISELLVQLKRGDEEAATLLWHRTVNMVGAAARKRLSRLHVRDGNEDDV